MSSVLNLLMWHAHPQIRIVRPDAGLPSPMMYTVKSVDVTQSVLAFLTWLIFMKSDKLQS